MVIARSLLLRQRALDGAAQGSDGHLLDHGPLVVDRAVGVGSTGRLWAAAAAPAARNVASPGWAPTRAARAPDDANGVSATAVRPTPASPIRPSGPIQTMTAQPTVEKSPARRSILA